MPIVEKYYYQNISYIESKAQELDDHFATIGNCNFRVAAKGKLHFISEDEIEVSILKIAIYVKDAFDFVDGSILSQPLGKWNFEKNDIKKLPSIGYYSITNSDYRDYRIKSEKGEDFYWYSNHKIIDVSNHKIKFKL